MNTINLTINCIHWLKYNQNFKKGVKNDEREKISEKHK